MSAVDDLRAVDVSVYTAIAACDTPELDSWMRRLSHVADRSALWFGIAAVLGVVPGRPRRAALLGVQSIAVTSASVNIVAKRLFVRSRPDRAAAAVPLLRRVRMPGSTSFPSGHSASAFAFASAVGGQLPGLSLPLHVLAATVAYSRVHTGVHYPADTIVGAAIGASCAAGTTYFANKMRERLTVPGEPAHLPRSAWLINPRA
jgi:undecaprenyl-diphosphatase